MSESFGHEVNKKAALLTEQGKDANQTSKILFDQDKQGSNYGIGIALMGDGKPMPTAPVTRLSICATRSGTMQTRSAPSTASSLARASD